MLLRVRAEASTGKLSIPEIPVLGLSYRKGCLSGEQAGTYPYFGSFPEQGRGQKEGIGLNPLGVEHHFFFLHPVPRKAGLAIPREGME